MSAFLSGATVDCGPSNVLKNVGGRLDRDYSLQQDRLVSTPNVAGPSSRALPDARRPPQMAAAMHATPGTAPKPFNLSTLRDQLPPEMLNRSGAPKNPDLQHSTPFRSPPAPDHPTVFTGPPLIQPTFSGWATEYNEQGQAKKVQFSSNVPLSWFDSSSGALERDMRIIQEQQAAAKAASSGATQACTSASQPPRLAQTQAPPWQRPPGIVPHQSFAPGMRDPYAYDVAGPAAPMFFDQIFPSRAPPQPQVGRQASSLVALPGFTSPLITSHQSQTSVPAPSSQNAAAAPLEPLSESQDLLSRTARTLLDDATSYDLLAANPKLVESKFMALMRGLGAGEVVVQEGQAARTAEEVGEGAKLVSRAGGANWAGSFLEGMSTVSAPETTMTAKRPGLQQVMTDQYGAQAIHDPILGRQSLYGVDIAPFSSHPEYISAWERQFQDQEAIVHSDSRPRSQRRKSVHFEAVDDAQMGLEREDEAAAMGRGVPNTLEESLGMATAISGMNGSWEEYMDDLPGVEDFAPGLTASREESRAQDMQGLQDAGEVDEDGFMAFNGPMRAAAEVGRGVGEREGWGELQRDWEAFAAEQKRDRLVKGERERDAIERYLFQARNPYTGMQVDGRVSPTLKGVLQLEAEVQNAPANYEAWYALGLKQQENEREDAAILALSKVVQLEPTYRPAYLALAVSYTNEGSHEAANTMMEKWIELGEGVDASSTSGEGVGAGVALADDQRRLVERLIDVARRSPDEVDPDTQVALGVLFNSSEEYGKAEDCFLAALAVRPDDWLLYNRLGATLANSGRSNEAISYYHKALALHPNFVRALFNLGISYINLGQYPLAAQRILDALRLQHADATEGYTSVGKAGELSVKGVTSDTLWTALRNACLHMGRSDLVALANKKDLSAFPFDLLVSEQAARTFA